MKEPTISLIILAYNEEKYIGTCLEYVIKNSNGKFLEIIVVDNASTDKTKDVSERYDGVKVVREDWKGMVRARQRGFLEAKGDILAYIDADTRMPECWVDTVISEFKKNSNLACLSGPYVYYDISKWDQFLYSTWSALSLIMSKIIGYMATGGNFAIRKDVLEKMNGFDTSIEFYGEDTNIARRAHKFGKVKFKSNFYMPTSGRRLKEQGIYRTGYTYLTNFLSEVFWHKPITREYKDYR